MEELEKVIESLEREVDILIQKNRELKQKSESHKAEIVRLKGFKAECELEIDSLKKKNEALLVAGLFGQSENGGRAATLAIEKILREIDDCIALVNK